MLDSNRSAVSLRAFFAKQSPPSRAEIASSQTALLAMTPERLRWTLKSNLQSLIPSQVLCQQQQCRFRALFLVLHTVAAPDVFFDDLAARVREREIG